MDNVNYQQNLNVNLSRPQVENPAQRAKPQKRKLFYIAPLIAVTLTAVLLTILYFINKSKAMPTSSINNKNISLETSIELTSKPSDWPTFVNLQAGYTLKYPRELSIREMHSAGGYIPFVTNDVAFEMRTSKPQISIVASVNKDTNVKTLSDWVRNHSGSKIRSEQRYFDTVENLKQSKVGGFDAVDFIEKSKFCFEGPCSETLTRWLIVNKNDSLLGLSCDSCPKAVDSIWNEMANSLVIFTSNNPSMVISGTSKFTHAGISVEYPNGWFYKIASNQEFILSSFNTEGFYTGSYLGGIEIYVERCRSPISECLASKGIRGSSLSDQSVIDFFGGIAEKIDTPTMEGIIYGKMDPETYNSGSNPYFAIINNRNTGKPVHLFTQLSLYRGSFELKKRNAEYYYPALKKIVQSIEIL